MNSNDKNLIINDNAKNCKIPKSEKEAIPCYVHLWHKPCSSNLTKGMHVNNKANKKTDLNVPTVMTKRLPYFSSDIQPQIHESFRKVYQNKHAAFKTTKDSGSPTGHKKKHSKALVSDKKSSALPACKQTFTLKTNEDVIVNYPNDETSKKPLCKMNKNRNSTKVMKNPGKNTVLLPEYVTPREDKEKNYVSKKKEPFWSTSIGSQRIDLKEGNHCIRKYSKNVNLKNKIQLYSKLDNNGAARTRIFKREKSFQVDENLTRGEDIICSREAGCTKNRFVTKNSLPLIKQKKSERGNQNSNSINSYHNGEQNFINAPCNIKNNYISLCDRGFATPKSETDCHQNQEIRESFVRLSGEKTSPNLSFVASSKHTLPPNTKIDLSQERISISSKGVAGCWNNDTLKKNEKKSTTDSIKILDHYYDDAAKSLTASKISPASQEEVIYHTNLINYGYHSNQRYCELSNMQQNRKHIVNAAAKFTEKDGNQSMVNDNAKYDLMKALIEPATKIHDSRDIDHKTSKLLISGHGLKGISTYRDEQLENLDKNFSNDRSLNEEAYNVSNVVKQSEDNTNDLRCSETLNSHASTIDLKQPLSNTSNYTAMNLKLRGCKYTKKYRQFQLEEKNVCSYMARYMKKMVTNEKKYQGIEKKGNSEREEVQIIIDENSPKTSRIRIGNNRSSVSVVCHSLGKTLSSNGGKNNAMANKVESSGGVSSGYKSFYNHSNFKNSDIFDQIEVKSEEQHDSQHSAVITCYNPRSVYVDHHNPIYYKTLAEPLRNEVKVGSSDNTCEPFYAEHSTNKYNGKILEDLDSQPNVYTGHKKQNSETKYSSYDAKNYLSTFTNCMDVYLPCEITAYQFGERKRSKLLQLNNKELMEKEVDNAELYIGRYLSESDSSTTHELSKEEESREKLRSLKNFTSLEDEMIVLKEPDDLKHGSLEFYVKQGLLEPDNPGTRIDSTQISAVSAQCTMVTSSLDVNPEEITESSERLTNVSRVKFAIKTNGSATVIKSTSNTIKTNHSNTFPQALHLITKLSTNKRSGTTCSRTLKNGNENSDDSNVIYELWTHKKSAADSTDNDSHSSGSSQCGKFDPNKYDTNKYKFNIFRKPRSSPSEKITSSPFDQVPKPPSPFLQISMPSQSTTTSSRDNTNALQSDIAIKVIASAVSISCRNSLIKPRVDIAPIHYTTKIHTDAISNENIDHLKFRINRPISIEHKNTEKHPGSSLTTSSNTKLFVKSEEQHSALPPPASALPRPYPFCCPLVPYMMQYWQNDQQPPPASTVPLPEADWKPSVSMIRSQPPASGIVPTPWLAPMVHMNNPLTSGRADSNVQNNVRAQPPPGWQMIPRGYAPCLPCSKTHESHLRETDSLILDDSEPALQSSDKRDGRKNKVSNKLFKIFRRKNKSDAITFDENDQKGRYHQSRTDARTNNIQTVQSDQQNLDDHSIWESSDIAGIVTPEELGRCFRRGFRADGLTLSGDNYLCIKTPSDTALEQEDVFNFSDHDTPLDFLLALGFSVDEATAAIKDDEVRSRFKAALTEARIWVPHIATTQGTLLYLLAMKAKPKVMRYFLQLVESIVNKRITNAVKLDAYLKILEKVEEGYVSFVTLFGKDTGKDDEENTVMVEKQRRRIFYTIYKYAESEAKEIDRPLTRVGVDLLHSLASHYRPAIGPHLRLLACYIGEGLLTKDVQLEAALIYLSRLDSAYVRLADLEKYCGLPQSERRKMEQSAKTES